MNKNNLKIIFEYLSIFTIFTFLTFFINRHITIRGLYMDDLYMWSWFPNTSLYDFAIKFYESTRYRPVYYILQYLEFLFVKNNVIYFSYVNIFLNSLIATFVYKFSKKLNNGIFISFLIGFFYIMSHFSYYQIHQVIGIIETFAQFFALLILYICINYIENDDYNKTKLFSIYFLFFLVAFTHERFLCLAPLIILSFIFKKIKNEDKSLKNIFITSTILVIEILLILYIRILGTGKMLPAGTGGTFVEDTFSIKECFSFLISQILFIFGINAGPEHLVGITFNDTISLIKNIIYISILFILIILSIYIYLKIKYISKIKTNNKFKCFFIDVLFLTFIASCIGASSVTIRVEMRFVYVSFTASIIYLSYILSSIHTMLRQEIIKKEQIELFFLLTYMSFIGFFITRNYVEHYYRRYYSKIYCITDQMRVNSLADNTVYKYGIDEILNNKRVFIFFNKYNFTNFYSEYFFKIYDKNYIGIPIHFINDDKDFPSDFNPENDILLLEDLNNNGYINVTDQFSQSTN